MEYNYNIDQATVPNLRPVGGKRRRLEVVGDMDSTPAVKKPKRVFFWFFLFVQVIFVFWIFAGLNSVSPPSIEECGTLDVQACTDARDVGTGIGVILIISLWAVMDFILAVTYAIYRFVKR